MYPNYMISIQLTDYKKIDKCSYFTFKIKYDHFQCIYYNFFISYSKIYIFLSNM